MKQPQAHRNGFYNTNCLSVGVRAGESRVRIRASRRAIVVLCLACVLVSRLQSSAHGLRETGSVAELWMCCAGRAAIAIGYLSSM